MQAALPNRFEAATVDHGLREESASEAEYAADVCAYLSILHAVLPVEVGKGNVQAEARAARYVALAQWMKQRGLHALASAHHADDQAETLMMRLNRGSGLSGLSGVRARGPIPQQSGPQQSGSQKSGPQKSREVIRPLLSWRKVELEAVCAAAGVTPVHDPSNENDQFDRARMRKALAKADWIDPLALAQSAQHLAEAQSFIERKVEKELAGDRLTRGAERATYTPSRHAIIAHETVKRIVEDLSGKSVRGGEIARLVGRLQAGQNASLAGILARSEKADDGAQYWIFEREPARSAGSA